MTSTEVYATAAELKAQMQGADRDEDQYTIMLTAASRAIDNYCNRPDGFVAVTTATARVYSGRGKDVQWIDECIDVTKVEVRPAVGSAYVEWASTNWIAGTGDPRFGDYNRTPYNWILVTESGQYNRFTRGSEPTVRVTARWGYAETVPDPVKQACITIAARWFKRGEGAWSDVLATGDFGQLIYRLEMDPDAKMMLAAGRFVRPAI